MILSKTTDTLTISLAVVKTTNELVCYESSNMNGIKSSNSFLTSGTNNVNVISTSPINNNITELTFLNVFNSDTITHTLTIKLNTYKIKEFEMLVGDSMTYSNGVFQMYNVKGIKK